MRLTMRTSLALKTLMFCAVNAERIVRRHEVAEACVASENHLAQVIHMLGQKKYLRTLRGRAGGLMLARCPSQITIGQVFRDFEGVLPFSSCIGGSEGATSEPCALAGSCRITCVMAEALDAFYARLDRATLSEMVHGNTGLAHILRVA